MNRILRVERRLRIAQVCLRMSTSDISVGKHLFEAKTSQTGLEQDLFLGGKIVLQNYENEESV